MRCPPDRRANGAKPERDTGDIPTTAEQRQALLFKYDFNYSRDAAEDARVRHEIARKERNTWKDVVIEACVLNCIEWYEEDPRKTLDHLIKYEVMVALDPAIPGTALPTIGPQA